MWFWPFIQRFLLWTKTERRFCRSNKTRECEISNSLFWSFIQRFLLWSVEKKDDQEREREIWNVSEWEYLVTDEMRFLSLLLSNLGNSMRKTDFNQKLQREMKKQLVFYLSLEEGDLVTRVTEIHTRLFWVQCWNTKLTRRVCVCCWDATWTPRSPHLNEPHNGWESHCFYLKFNNYSKLIGWGKR